MYIYTYVYVYMYIHINHLYKTINTITPSSVFFIKCAHTHEILNMYTYIQYTFISRCTYVYTPSAIRISL